MTECERIQEDLACERSLSEASQAHVLACARCAPLALELSELQASIDEFVGGEVPTGFVDRVMSGIERTRTIPLRLRLAYYWGAALLFFGLLAPSAAGAQAPAGVVESYEIPMS